MKAHIDGTLLKHVPSAVSMTAVMGGLLVLLGGTVLLGWWLRIAPLVRVLPHHTPMFSSTALSFVLITP